MSEAIQQSKIEIIYGNIVIKEARINETKIKC